MSLPLEFGRWNKSYESLMLTKPVEYQYLDVTSKETKYLNGRHNYTIYIERSDIPFLINAIQLKFGIRLKVDRE